MSKVSMILPQHPDKNATKLLGSVPAWFREKFGAAYVEKKWPRAIGYWKSKYEPTLPNPEDFVDEDWDASERDRVIKYLKRGYTKHSWKGASECRFCGKWPNGSTCLGDDDFVWPEGFAHYLEVHAVRPPQEFVDHVIAKTTKKPKKTADVEVAASEVDTEDAEIAETAPLDDVDLLDGKPEGEL